MATGARLRRLWESSRKLPGGKWVFSRILGWYIPYTGSIGARVETLQPGHAEVSLRDRRKVRNHLHSIHAIALANLAELTTGLATLSGIPDDARAILVGLEVSYEKKARGRLLATCECNIPETSERREYLVESIVKDSDGDTVAIGKACWLIGPEKL